MAERQENSNTPTTTKSGKIDHIPSYTGLDFTRFPGKTPQKPEVNTMSTCPKCGRNYTASPAISRSDNETEICPVCGAEESIAFLSEKQREEIITKIEAAERTAGQID